MSGPPDVSTRRIPPQGDAGINRSDPLAVEVFCVATDGFDPAAVERLLGELSSEEVRRAKAFAFDDDRRTYVAAHTMLRRVLRQRLGPAEPCFIRGPHGRPELAMPQASRPVPSFNLTHTRGFAACALTDAPSVGIDAEDTRRKVDIAAFSRRWFAPSECQWLEQLPEAGRADAFFRIWTLKEAIAKATGHGLQIPTERFAVEPDTWRVVIPGELKIPTAWLLAELQPAPHIRVAVAVPGTGHMIAALTRLDLV
jgi:4'-phosphopantetheinyl transferase